MPKELVKYILISALVGIAYILIVLLIYYLFGSNPGNAEGIFFLSSFVFPISLSVAFLMGKPIMLYMDGVKKVAIVILGLTLGWIALFMMARLISHWIGWK